MSNFVNSSQGEHSHDEGSCAHNQEDAVGGQDGGAWDGTLVCSALGHNGCVQICLVVSFKGVTESVVD